MYAEPPRIHRLHRPAAFLNLGWRYGSRGFASPTVRDQDPRPWLEVRRTLRRRQRPRNSSWRLERLGLLLGALLVLLTTIPTGWWVSSQFVLDPSALSATILSFAPPRGRPPHPIVGYTGDDTSGTADLSPAPAPTRQDGPGA